MFNWRKLLSIFLCIALLLSLAACKDESTPPTSAPTSGSQNTTDPDPTSPPPTDPPASELLNSYASLRETLLSADSLELEIEMTQQITIGTQSYSVTSNQEVLLSGLQSDELQAMAEEDIDCGDYDDSFEEYYTGGMLYTTICDEYHYKGEMTREEFLDRYAPAVPLDETLYQTVKEDADTIRFSDPTAAESWALPEGAVMQTASGWAEVSDDDSMESCYKITYSYGGAEITCRILVEASVSGKEVHGPDEATPYILLEDVEAPRMMDLGVLSVLSSTCTSSTISEIITCHATGTVCNFGYELNTYGTGKDYRTTLETNLNVFSSADNSSFTQKVSERFENGTYSMSVDGGAPEKNPAVTADVMLEYCFGILSENLISLGYFKSGSITDLGGITMLEFDCTDEYGDILCDYIYYTLFLDGEYLDKLSTSCVTKEATYTMALDPVTGLPTAITIHFLGSHTVEGTSYDFALDVTQSFDLNSATVYEEITGEPEPSNEPVESPAPLLYRITGPNGQQMWLFGTIHIGDRRTGALPQELLDAFASSDSLALEFNTEAYEQAIQNDPAYAQQLFQTYVYPDGTSISAHLDPEVYQQTVRFLKASGSYSQQVEHIRPSILVSEIENLYLRLGYELSPNWGMESQLLELAKKQNKAILEVESAISQVQMLTSFSDSLQQYLLEQALSTSLTAYWGQSNELFELWCAGDEAALRQVINEVPADMTSQEQQLHDEYDAAMSTNRNIKMLDVAKSYLESGETVFFAVGLAHLLDDGYGLVDALRAAGYTVEAVTYS